MAPSRRAFLKAGAWGLVPASLAECASIAGKMKAGKVVVVGAGYGGATAAKYLAVWSGGAIDVTLVEANAALISCPLSNLVLGGSKQLSDVTIAYDGLPKHGVKVVRGLQPIVERAAKL